MDIHDKNNIAYTKEHVDRLMKIGVPNLASCLLEFQNLKFPTNEQIEKAEKNLNSLEKNKFLYRSK